MNISVSTHLSCHRFSRRLAILLFALALSGCDHYKSSIPDMTVSLQVNLLSDITLRTIGSTLSYTTAISGLQSLGFGGILVVHTYDDAYCAFDLACPYEVSQTTRVEVQSDLTAVCPVCGSKYRIMDGTGWVINGPSKEKLKMYHVYPSDNYLYITN
jgi:nitrite reductase/ring-hydroxylating ferredoxin subunit